MRLIVVKTNPNRPIQFIPLDETETKRSVLDPFNAKECGEPGSFERIEHYRKLVESKGRIFG